MTFEEFWNVLYVHPENKGSKTRAHVRFLRIVAHAELNGMLAALDEYKIYQALNAWYSPKMCASWLGSAKDELWREWIPLGRIPKKITKLETDEQFTARIDTMMRIRRRENLPAISRAELEAIIRGD